MTTTALSPRTERDTEQIAQEVGHLVVAIRLAIKTGKDRLDEGIDPDRAGQMMTESIAAEQNRMAKLIARQTKPVAQALADRYGMEYLKKHTALQISVRLAAHIVDGITADSEDYDKVRKAASAARRRASGIAEADRVLRYWASLDGDLSDVWRWWRPESVLLACQYYGHVYLHCLGEESQSHTTPLETPLPIEQALRRTGNVALNHLLTGHGRGNSENMIMQMRVGELDGYLKMEIASRTVVMLTHGNIDVNLHGDDGVMVPTDSMLPTSLVPHDVQYGY